MSMRRTVSLPSRDDIPWFVQPNDSKRVVSVLREIRQTSSVVDLFSAIPPSRAFSYSCVLLRPAETPVIGAQSCGKPILVRRDEHRQPCVQPIVIEHQSSDGPSWV